MRPLRCLILVALASVLCGAKVLDGGAISLAYRHMSEDEARDVFERARKGHVAVTRYLGLDPGQKIVIRDLPPDDPSVGRTKIMTSHRTSRAIGPIEIHIPVRYLRGEPFKTALVHELTHAVAGSPADGNLFLAEGLAVHVAGVLARTDESDSFAKYPVHQAARQHLRRISVLNPIQHLYREREIFSDRERQFASGYTTGIAYAFAGSFVTWLIQRDGPQRDREAIAKFMEVYRGSDITQVYGQSLPALERQWISFVNAKPEPRIRTER